MILFPLFKGWGNLKQGVLGMLLSLAIGVMDLTHTYLVSESSLSRIQAGQQREEAQGDLTRTQTAAQQATEANRLAQQTYRQALQSWQSAARTARQSRQRVPPMPQPPQLQQVPQLDQSLVSSATMSVATAGEQVVSHRALLGLLFLMLLTTIIGAERLAALSHASRARKALLKIQEAEFKDRVGRLQAEVPK